MSGKLGALLFATGLPLGLFAGSAAADNWGGGDADVENNSEATAYVDQYSDVYTAQDSGANSGQNEALSGVLGVNLTGQECDADVSDGNISGADHDANAGNEGGDCENDADSSNNGTSKASIASGAATAKNDSKTNVDQDNSGGVDVGQSIKGTELHDGGDVRNNSYADLTVYQTSSVGTTQSAWANSGGNFAASGVAGVNLTGQSGSAEVDGGNINGGGGWKSDGHNLNTGNTGGSASNTAASNNTGNSTASVTTGAASASNSSTTTVTQSNSGGVGVDQGIENTEIH
jgi:hypothetical protein